MTSGQPGPRGGLNPVTHPDRFNATTGQRLNIKDTRSEILVFDNISPSGSDTVSSVITVGTIQGFSVFKKGTGNVEVQVSPNAASNIWITIDTLNANPDIFSTSDPYQLLRIVAKDGAAGIYVWVYRKYSIY